MSSITLEGQKFIPVKDWSHISSLVNQPLVMFSVRISDDMQGYETNDDVMYFGKLTRKTRISNPDYEGFGLYGAVKYERVDGEWVAQKGRCVAGMSKDDFEARRVHCPDFFYTEGVLD